MSTITNQSVSLVNTRFQTYESKNKNLLHRFVMFMMPRSQAKSIKIGLEQVKDIREGRVKTKSFEEAIAEL